MVEIFEFLKKRNRKKKSVDFSGVAFHDLMQFLNIDENCDRLSEVTYFTCMKVLGEGLSKLPLALQRVTSDGGVEDMQGLPLWETVKVRPNRFMSPTTFWNTVENNRNHWGNAYVWINRKIGGSVELWILPSECMQIELDQLSDLSDMDDITYVYTSPYSGQIFHIPSMDILHFKGSMIFNGLIGMSVREKLKMSLDSAMLSQKMLNELYKNHFVPKAAVQFDVNSFVEKDLETEYLKSLQEYADGKNANGTSFIPLLPGTTIVPLNIRLTDGQFLELRKYTALQIAAAFGIKPNHLNDYEKSSYANSEAQQLAFYTDTMLYILKQYEEELNFKLLSEMQRAAGFRFKFNLAAVLRGDTKTQVESLSKGISSGLYTPDEARRNLDLPAKPGGDRLYFNGSNIPIDLAGTQYQMQAQNENTKAMLKLAESIEKVLGCGIIDISKYSDSQPRDDHGRWTDGGGGSSGSSGGGASSGRLNDSSPEFYPTSDEIINSVPEITAFDSEELNHAVHTSCKDILMSIKDDIPGTEATISISLDLTQKSEIQKGELGAGTVKAIPLDVPYVSIHNHASGETFSKRDLRKFIKDDSNIHSVVVGNNGHLFILSKTENYNDLKMISALRYIIKSDGLSEEMICKGLKEYGIKYYENKA